MISAPWHFRHQAIPCPRVWAEPRGLLLMNRTWQKWRGVTLVIGLQKTVTTISLAPSLLPSWFAHRDEESYSVEETHMARSSGRPPAKHHQGTEPLNLTNHREPNSANNNVSLGMGPSSVGPGRDWSPGWHFEASLPETLKQRQATPRLLA